MLNKKIFGIEVKYILVMFVLFSHAGWLVENIFRSIRVGVWDSRFHMLPFISPYGLIALAVPIAIGNPDDLCFFGHRVFRCRRGKLYSNLVCVVAIVLAVFLGELVVGNLWDLLFGVKLWNYNRLPLHVTQYTSVVTALSFGLGAYLIIKLVYFPVINLLRKINYSWFFYVFGFVAILSVIDTVVMIITIVVTKSPPMYYSIKLR